MNWMEKGVCSTNATQFDACITCDILKSPKECMVKLL